MSDFTENSEEGERGAALGDGAASGDIARLQEEDCINFFPGDACHGSVRYRYPLSPSGRSFPRCQKHWEERFLRQQKTEERYPENAPHDFDPAAAGEYWDEEY